MNYITVERMAKYYAALLLIAGHNYSYRSACSEVGIACIGDLSRVYRVIFKEMTDLYGDMITALEATNADHSRYSCKGPYPIEEENDVVVRIPENEWRNLEEEVSQWPYYDDKPYAIHRWQLNHIDQYPVEDRCGTRWKSTKTLS